jgi:hypothetical protein
MDEVYLLSHHQAPAELYDKLIAWRASYNYEFIKSLENVIIKDYSSINKKLSKQENELRKQYINWLAVGLEGDKFKTLDNVRLNLARRQQRQAQNDDDENESYHDKHHMDMLTHRGIL